MLEQRREPRLLCSELVTVSWRDPYGKPRQTVAVLEDISHSGACCQLDGPIPCGESVLVRYSTGEFPGEVRYCRFDEIGFYVGVEFAPPVKWTESQFHPSHLLDPHKLSS